MPVLADFLHIISSFRTHFPGLIEFIFLCLLLLLFVYMRKKNGVSDMFCDYSRFDEMDEDSIYKELKELFEKVWQASN